MQTAQSDDGDFVIGCMMSACVLASSAVRHTVNSKIAQGCTGSSLNFEIGTLKKEEDGFEGIALNLSDIWRNEDQYVVCVSSVY